MSVESPEPVDRTKLVVLPQLVPGRTCLQCDVCCRFPEADSFLRPYFTDEEIRRAVAAGVPTAHFPNLSGGQIALVPNGPEEGFLCPAFDPTTSQCRIYEVRPLDCQIYPLALMWDKDGAQVVLGWDSKCPWMREASTAESGQPPVLSSAVSFSTIREYADHIAVRLDADDMVGMIARHPRLVGRYQDDVVVLRGLPRLTARLNLQPGFAGEEIRAPVAPSRASRLDLRPLRLEDRTLMERACGAFDTPLAAYALAPHYIWRHQFAYTWADVHGHLCLFADYADGLFMPLPPLPLDWGPTVEAGGPEHRAVRGIGDEFFRALEVCFRGMQQRNGGSAVTRIENVPEELAGLLRASGYRLTEKWPDYVYRAADLALLAGDRYKSQRWACNRFERRHDHRFEHYERTHRDACLRCFDAWTAQKVRKGLEPVAKLMMEDAAGAHMEALSNADALGLTGHIVVVDGAVRAYSLTFDRSSGVCCVLLEVADRQISGLAQVLFRETCRAALSRGRMLINTMDDSGLQDLARSKRAYHPLEMVASYVVSGA